MRQAAHCARWSSTSRLTRSSSSFSTNRTRSSFTFLQLLINRFLLLNQNFLQAVDRLVQVRFDRPQRAPEGRGNLFQSQVGKISQREYLPLSGRQASYGLFQPAA